MRFKLSSINHSRGVEPRAIDDNNRYGTLTMIVMPADIRK